MVQHPPQAKCTCGQSCNHDPCCLCDPPTARQMDQTVGRYNNESSENLIAQRQAFIQAQSANMMTMIQNQQAFTLRLLGGTTLNADLNVSGGGA